MKKSRIGIYNELLTNVNVFPMNHIVLKVKKKAGLLTGHLV